MAAITTPMPGTEHLCAGPCAHQDCAQHREDAAAICPHCRKPIGYGRAWVKQDLAGPAHFDCADEHAATPEATCPRCRKPRATAGWGFCRECRKGGA